MGYREIAEELAGEIKRRVPDVVITHDQPSDADGIWWIDVKSSGYIASVEYRPTKGFGVAAPGGGYGEGPDVVFQTASEAADQLVAFLVTARLRETSQEVQHEREIAAHVTRSIQRLEERLEALRNDLAASIATVSDDVKHLESELHQLVVAAADKSQNAAARD
jgi:hypothetical protein